jgi:uncharacterized protein YjiS (DUF1127 family)
MEMRNDLCLQGRTRPGYGLLKAFRTISEVLEYAFELSQTCDRMLQRQRERQRLLELDDHLLEDIGLTRAQAERTGRKRFWQ